MLKLGVDGPFHALFSFAHEQGMPVDVRYFWLTGILSAFLDNAPTYLLFFKMAGGNAQTLMHQLPSTLLAISLGRVLFCFPCCIALAFFLSTFKNSKKRLEIRDQTKKIYHDTGL